MDGLLFNIAILVSLVLGITIHEFSHALSADLLGDPTARYQGRLTLNPLAHFDPMGGLMVLVSALSGMGFGWGKPVPVNPVNLRLGPRVGMAVTAFAGPFSNLVLATLCAAPVRVAISQGLPLPGVAYLFLIIMATTNIGLAVFNLLPIPPLDGFSVLRGILSTIRATWAYRMGQFMDRTVVYGPIIFIAIIALDTIIPGVSILGTLLRPLQNLLTTLILGNLG